MMKRLLFLLLSVSFINSYAQYSDSDIVIYVDHYKELAIRKMYEYKIPASITIAQGIFESGCGTSRLATEGNNHFGIKCHKDWIGDTILVDDDEDQECFRQYKKVEDSYDDHSRFLTTRPRYSQLFQLEIMDYTAWAKGLKEAGYATNPKYADRIISLIERFGLAELDTIYQERLAKGWFEMAHPEIVMEEESVNISLVQAIDYNPVFIPNVANYAPVDYPFSSRTTYENNKTLFVIAEKGDTYAKIAKEVQSDEKTLRYYNDVPPKRELTPGEIVYIEKKGKSCSTLSHKMEKEESLHYLSQKYGIRMSVIMDANQLNEKSQLKPGSIIKLKKEHKCFLYKWFE
jgi:LysM repeat protein